MLEAFLSLTPRQLLLRALLAETEAVEAAARARAMELRLELGDDVLAGLAREDADQAAADELAAA